MQAEDGRAWLELVLEMAPRLREAGILRVGLGPLQVDLSATAPATSASPVDARRNDDEPDEPAEPMADPLDDGDTYGTKDAPGYAALRRL